MKPGDIVSTKQDVLYLFDVLYRSKNDVYLPNRTMGLVVANMTFPETWGDDVYVLFTCSKGMFWSAPIHLRLVYETG